MKKICRVLPVIACSFIFLLTLKAWAAPLSIIEDFDGNSFDESNWMLFTQASGSAAIENERLELQIGGQPDSVAGLISLFSVAGDFDARVDFSDFGESGMLLLIFGPGDPNAEVGKSSDAYFVNRFPVYYGISTNDTSGSIRLSRVGTTFSGYYWDRGWQLISSGSGGAMEGWAMALVLRGSTGRVAIDNISIVADPAPTSLLLLLKDDVKKMLGSGMLTQDQADGLTEKLGTAIISLDAGNNRAAFNQLNAFINQVNAFIHAGKITPEEGQNLIDAAENICVEIG